jgi:hypothetical protein
MKWYGMIMESINHSMDSIWNGIWSEIFTKSNMDSMFIPWTVFHGFHGLDSMDSTWNPYGMDLGLIKI